LNRWKSKVTSPLKVSLEWNQTHASFYFPDYYSCWACKSKGNNYIGESKTTFAKTYGIKVGCCGDHVQEHIANLVNILGTSWELIGTLKEHNENTLGRK
jgi:hypothetical protein